MSLVERRIETFKAFLGDEQLTIFEEKEISYGYQIVVTNGIERVPVNFFNTGKISVQGKASVLQTQLREWSQRHEDGALPQAGVSHTKKYVVSLQHAEKIQSTILDNQPSNIRVQYFQPQPTEQYRAEINQDRHRVAVTYYQNGTLLVQGKESELLEGLCNSIRDVLSISIEELASEQSEPQQPRIQDIDELKPGRVLRDRLIEEKLGQGGFGIVYKATHQRLGRIEAIKRTVYSDDSYLRLFESEAKMLVNLEHQSLPKVYDYFQEGKHAYLAMEYIPGTSLNEHVQNKSENGLSLKVTLDTIKSVIDALIYLHQQTPPIVHRDIKPDNIRITPDQKVYLVDFGIAKKIIEGTQTTKLKQAASPGFSPIEQHMSRSTNTQTDIYALGATLYYMLSGVVPIPATERHSIRDEKDDPLPPLGDMNTEVTLELQAVIKRMMAILPEDRYQSMIEVKDALEDVAGGTKASLTQADKVFQGNYQTSFAAKSRESLTINEPGDDDEPLFPETDVSSTRVDIPTQEESVVAHAGWVGTDESGKGDVFGPLVVAAVYVEPEQAIHLHQIGIRDSKTLAPARIWHLANQIIKLCPHHYKLVLEPREYNQQYQQLNNLNHLLALQHAKAIKQIQQDTNVERVLVDKFAEESVLIAALNELGCSVMLEQRPKAEDDTAVAAASIIARAAFIHWIAKTKEQLGFVLPMGADVRAIEAGKQIVAHYGRSELAKYAKLHFRTVREMLTL
jgi:ribonuclease HIII